MRRITFRLGITLALVVGNLVLASAASPDASNDEKVRTLRLVARTVATADLDLGATGLSLGDRFVFTEDLYQQGRRVGQDNGECTITRITGTGANARVTSQCLVTATLPGGQLTVQGAATFTETGAPAPFTLAVTGGTGDYQKARGQVRVRETSETEAELTIRLIL
jgi:hypothetical protein